MTPELATVALAKVVTGLAAALSMALREAGDGFSVELYFDGEKVEFTADDNAEDIWSRAVSAVRKAQKGRAQ